ncbi:recombinase family protein [Moorena sp. SIO4G3]|uniref:recombinase family protein n=1 Tax=Moorena sp. SIO4G3 TaxID=2607821 RepID=UPI0025E70DA3|nr:recombinase family protein [Moorena sp. SIO4G3]
MFPNGEVIKDIGTGLNYRRKGLKALLGRVLSRDVSEIVVAHKDRMARFGFELIEWICEQNGCRIVVLDQSNLSDEREMVEDVRREVVRIVELIPQEQRSRLLQEILSSCS